MTMGWSPCAVGTSGDTIWEWWGVMKEEVKTELMHTDARMLLHMVTVPCSGASYSFWGEDSFP